MLSKTDAILYVREHYHLFINHTEPDTIMPEEDFKKAVDVVLKKCGIAQVSSIIKTSGFATTHVVVSVGHPITY